MQVRRKKTRPRRYRHSVRWQRRRNDCKMQDIHTSARWQQHDKGRRRHVICISKSPSLSRAMQRVVYSPLSFFFISPFLCFPHTLVPFFCFSIDGCNTTVLIQRLHWHGIRKASTLAPYRLDPPWDPH